MEPYLEKLAKIGYKAYGVSTGNKNYLGLPMPAWTELPEKIKAAWMAAAEAMLRDIEETDGEDEE